MGGSSALRWLVRASSVILAGAMVAALAPAASASAAQESDDINPLIVRGRNATQVYSFMVSLQSGGRHFCGGSLISSRWVVTARHCVSGPGFQMRIGTINRTTGGTVVTAIRVVRNPTSDVALVQTNVAVTNHAPIIIAPATSIGQATRILGWGQTCPVPGCSGAPVILQELDTRLVPDPQCGGIQGPTEICVGNTGGVSGACYGDSGGPAVTPTAGGWLLTGATSRSGGGSVCAQRPAIYGDIPSHRAWIRSVSGV